MPEIENPRHEAFARGIASGMKAVEAYRAVYGAKVGAARQSASDLLTKPVISDRVQELQRKSASKFTLNMQRRREILYVVAEDEEAKDADRIAAIMADAKLAGELSDTVNVNLRQPLTPEQILAAVQRSPALAALGRS